MFPALSATIAPPTAVRVDPPKLLLEEWGDHYVPRRQLEEPGCQIFRSFLETWRYPWGHPLCGDPIRSSLILPYDLLPPLTHRPLFSIVFTKVRLAAPLALLPPFSIVFLDFSSLFAASNAHASTISLPYNPACPGTHRIAIEAPRPNAALANRMHRIAPF